MSAVRAGSASWFSSFVLLAAVGAYGQPATQPVAPVAVLPPLPVWPSELETITDRAPTFLLNGRFGASRYRIELARSPSFDSPTVIEKGFHVTDNDAICPTASVKWAGEPLADGQYYWRAFCAAAGGDWTPAANYRTFFVSAVDVDAVKVPRAQTHPYLLFAKDDIPALREKLRTSPRHAKAYRYLYNAAVAMLDAAPVDEDFARASQGQHGNYNVVAGWYTLHMTKLAFVWHLSGEDRFGAKAKECLLTICGYRQWIGEKFLDRQSFDPIWNATLETAMITHAAALGYDLLYERLTPDEREIVRNAIITKGVRPLVHDWADPVGSSTIPRHQTATGNWAMVCANAGGVGALAVLAEHPEAANWVRLVRNRVRWWFHDRGGDWFVDNPYAVGRPSPIPILGPSEPNFDADGGYKESHSYMNYAMMYVCFFGDALRRVTGENVFTHVPSNLLDLVLWSMYAEPDRDRSRIAAIDFGDCAAIAAYSYLYAALVKHRSDGLAQWLYHRTVPASDSVHTLLWHDESVAETPPSFPLPLKHFRGIGQVLMRSGWGIDDLLVGVKFHQNRGHHDLGTFCIARNGAAVIDSGVSDYGGSIYQTYLAHSEAHNVILVDGQRQTRTDGRCLVAMATPAMAATAGELATAYPATLRSWTRDVVFVPPGCVFTIDRLRGRGTHRYEYLLHPDSPFETEADGGILWGHDGEQRNRARWLLNTHPVASVENGYRATQPRKYLRLSRPGEPREAETLAAVFALGVPMPECTTKECGDGPEKGMLVLAGPAMDPASFDFDGDAAVVCRESSAGDTRLYLRHAARLTEGGRMLLAADARMDAVMEMRSNGIVGRARCEQPSTVRLHVTRAIAGVSVNHRPSPIRSETEQTTLTIPAGESEFLIQYEDAPALADRTANPPRELPALPPTDAPAYGAAIARASRTWNDPAAAIDGNPNTVWCSLPHAPMPQWFEVGLARPQPIRDITIDTALPCAFEVLTGTAGDGAWTSHGRHTTNEQPCVATVKVAAASVDRIRVVFHEIDAANSSALIRELSWR